VRTASATIAILACLALAACGDRLGPEARELVLVLPEVPRSWADLPGISYEVEWIGPSGLRESAEAAPGACLAIRVPWGRSQAIRARPSSLGRPLSPAGALYPQDLAWEAPAPPWIGAIAAREELVLDWLGGYVAEVAACLERAGLEPSRYDLGRLKVEAGSRAADPWSALAPREVARRLAEGSFRADGLRERTRFAVALPGPGPWAPESALSDPPLPRGEDGGWEWEALLAEGTHRLIGPDGELLLSVDSSGENVAVRLPREPSGRERARRLH